MPGHKKLPQGGALIRQPEAAPEHVGALPDLTGIECLPPTEPPIEQLTREAEFAMELVQDDVEATSVSCEAQGREPFSPPTSVPWGRDEPAELDRRP
jgi:hypothetical protein